MWTASANMPWITSLSATNGTGTSVVTFSVGSNPSSLIRTGQVIAAGQILTVVENACTFGLSGTTTNAPVNGELTGINVIANGTACTWTATANVPWIGNLSPTNGAGSSLINYSVAGNTSGLIRTGLVTAAGQILTVTQNACTYNLGSTTTNAPVNGALSSVNVVANGTACTWTASANVPWIENLSPTNATGSSLVMFTVGGNTSGLIRTGQVTAAGQIFTVTQNACTYNLSGTTTNAPVNGALSGVNVTANGTDCTWTATANVPWISNLSPTNGTGSSLLTFSVGGNTSGLIRTGLVNAAGLVLTVTQNACTYNLSGTTTNAPVNGALSGVNVIANGTDCTWTASANVPWITNLSTTNGTGSSSLTFSVGGNTSGLTRTGQVTAAGQVFTVTQDACSFSLPAVTSTNVPAGGLNLLSFTLTANGTACTWTASADVPWINNLAPGSGSGATSISCSIPGNPLSTTRTGQVTAAGLTYTINQLGATSAFNDGIPDWWRQEYFGTSASTNSLSCSTCDATGTGQDNLFKYVTGLDPTNPASVFTFSTAPVSGQPGELNLSFSPLAAGRTYTPMFEISLTANAWSILSPIFGPVTNGNQVTVTDPSATGTDKFYEINISFP
jgi:hypothetical protein